MSLLLCVALLGAEPEVVNWPVFRGDGTSLSAAKELPLTWDDETNVAWNVPLAGYGQSSPVVWGDRAFVTSSSGDFKDKLHVQCLDVMNGKPLWQRNLTTPVRIKVSNYVSRGAPTPAVDAERLYAFFESGELVAFDHDGKELWQRSVVKDYGAYKGMHGLGSSLALTEKAVLVLFQHDGPSYLLAMNKKTGEPLWKIDRPQGAGWNSPIVAGTGENERIFISGNGGLAAYAPANGDRIWWVEGLEGNTVASATVTKDYVIVGSSEVGESIAVRRGGAGDVTSSHVAWRAERAKSSFGSPLVYRGNVYFVDRNGILYCLNLETGAERYTTRLPSSCWASPVGAGGRVYCFCNDGKTVVLKSGPELEVLATNSLTTEDRVYGVAAIARAFLVRTGERLVCFGKGA
jgi:outer membrane protein assembly factor BamB